MKFSRMIEVLLLYSAAKPHGILPTMKGHYGASNGTTPKNGRKIGSKMCHQGATVPKNNRVHRDIVCDVCFKFEGNRRNGSSDIVRKRKRRKKERKKWKHSTEWNLRNRFFLCYLAYELCISWQSLKSIGSNLTELRVKRAVRMLKDRRFSGF